MFMSSAGKVLPISLCMALRLYLGGAKLRKRKKEKTNVAGTEGRHKIAES